MPSGTTLQVSVVGRREDTDLREDQAVHALVPVRVEEAAHSIEELVVRVEIVLDQDVRVRGERFKLIFNVGSQMLIVEYKKRFTLNKQNFKSQSLSAGKGHGWPDQPNANMPENFFFFENAH